MNRIIQILLWFVEFVYAVDSKSQVLTTDQLSFLDRNIVTISNEQTINKGEWSYIKSYLDDNRIILLGEPNHGSKEIFEVRNNLIHYLHDSLGFNTILFESGIGELADIDIERNLLTPMQMTNGFFSGWRTKEFRNLMEYVKEKNISIAGFDVQRTGGSFLYLLNDAIRNTSIDTGFCKELEERFGLVQRELTNKQRVLDSLQEKTDKLISSYLRVGIILSAKNVVSPSKAIAFTLKTITNRIGYLRYMLQFAKDQDWHRRWAARDSIMAENFRWLCDSIYKKEKLVVIAHNFHISKYNENEKVMGEILAGVYGEEMYRIGIFAGGGVFHNNSGKEEKMVSADSTALDLKRVIAEVPGFFSYLDIPVRQSNGNRWLFESIIVNDTFIDLNGSKKMILAKHFDGLLLVKSVSLPEK